MGEQVKERTTSHRLRGRSSIAVCCAAIILAAASPSSANADKAAIIVTGKASERERTLVTDAVSEAVRKAALTVDGDAFKPDEIDSIVKCLRNDRPWPCIEPTARSRALARLVIVELDLVRPRPNTPALRVRFVFPDNERIAPDEERYCKGGCSEAKLLELAYDAVAVLFERTRSPSDPRPHVLGGAATLTVHVTPPGASIGIDGRLVGMAGDRLTTTAGRHTIDIELAGYERTQRTIEVRENETLVVELHPERRLARRSKVLPISLVAGGALLVAGCVAYGFTLDPTPNVPGRDAHAQPAYLVSWPAVGGVVLGAAAIGTGLYLWLRRDDNKPLSAPTATVVPGGAMFGWSGRFH
ncbi:MAG: PEGA domain-containing protein [Deltaproteobacteria bacterium]|nr:PEGA domain-containing protein [Deltaproteobacteria bacterium]